jgi:hypothetical protein
MEVVLALFMLHNDCVAAPHAIPQTFSGRPITVWLDDGRAIRLVEDFSFTDGLGYTWRAPKGAVIDGASIPQPLWSLMGSPFTGNYRNASILHDYFVDQKSHPASRVHALFFSASVASGEEISKSLMMLRAMHQFGSNWLDPPLSKMDVAFADIYGRHDAFLERKYGMRFDKLFDFSMTCLVSDPAGGTFRFQFDPNTVPFEQKFTNACFWLTPNIKNIHSARCENLANRDLQNICSEELSGYTAIAKRPPFDVAHKYTILQDLLFPGQ